MKLNGKNIPKKNRNAATTDMEYLGSLKCFRKSLSLSGVQPFGGSLDLRVRFAMIIMPRIKKAVMRIVQAGSPLVSIVWVCT